MLRQRQYLPRPERGDGQVLFCRGPWPGLEERLCVVAPFHLGQPMPIMFNALLREAGFPLCDVRLVRHADPELGKGHTPYEMWRDDRREFAEYQSDQNIRNRKKFAAPYWAVFLGTPLGKTLFVGIYGVRYLGKKAGRGDVYELTLRTRPAALGDLIGKLYVDWGEGRGTGQGGEQAWVQYADRHDKPITELRTEFADE